ncbi:dihydroneopterin aldolase [Pyrenophora seminiperda CCB06]|uniref:dihydroneopterin aldolase n=1 Tax=Pyrenophora seminiperda CCB06 TaxID=1302712 RepID=A0A3M7M226_9PLEO|nr:dihydroneopterin aldolase [Pyrenophora seminiperda CCB06]
MALVRQVQWDAEMLQSGHFDKIMVQNLEVVVPAGKDVWGREKKQRANISVTLTLRNNFLTADDTVDSSTVHYGTLSKAIQALFKNDDMPWISTPELCIFISNSVREVAGPTILYALETDVSYTKGCMFGEKVGYKVSAIETGTGPISNVLYLRNVRIPCLIGVNSNERLNKQPVNVDLWVNNIDPSLVDEYPRLEMLLFELISESSFQTIESLLAWLVKELKEKFFVQKEDSNVWVTLRIGKPHAVPFADAPAVEISRPIY